VSLLFEFDQRSDALNLPMWMAQGVVPVTLLLIVVMSLARVFVQVTGTESGGDDELGQR
jgi:TRAP-type C4-dicarboxylate transport system permease small subunit